MIKCIAIIFAEFAITFIDKRCNRVPLSGVQFRHVDVKLDRRSLTPHPLTGQSTWTLKPLEQRNGHNEFMVYDKLSYIMSRTGTTFLH